MTKYFCDQCEAEFEYAGLRRIHVKLGEPGIDPTREFRFEVCGDCYKTFLCYFDKITEKIKGPKDE